jgi:hypothetical protein
MNTFEHNRNILKSITSFNLLEKSRYEAPKEINKKTFSIPLPKQKHHKIIDNKLILIMLKRILRHIMDYMKPAQGL